MEQKDRKIRWDEEAYDVLCDLFGMLEEKNLVAADITLPMPGKLEAETVFTGPDTTGGMEWYIHACSVEFEGDIRVASIDDNILWAMVSTLEDYFGIKMTPRQELIAKMYDTVYPMLMEEHGLVSLPSDEISWVDDIDKVFNHECEAGDCASEEYGNGDYTVNELYAIRADHQRTIIEECFETFMEKVK